MNEVVTLFIFGEIRDVLSNFSSQLNMEIFRYNHIDGSISVYKTETIFIVL